MFKSFRFLLKLIWKFNKKYIFYAASFQLVTALVPLISVIMPKYIIDELTDLQRLEYLGIYVGILVLTNFVGTILLAFLRGAMFTSKSEVFNDFQCMMAEKLVTCDFESLENPEFLDTKEKAHKILYADGDGFGMVLDYAFNIVGKIFVFAGLIAVLSTLNVGVVFVFVILVLLNSLVESRVQKKYVSWDMEKAPIERRSLYLLNAIENFEYGKEERIYNLKEFLIRKISKHLGESDAFYKKQIRVMNKSQYFTAFTSLIRDGITYAYLIFNVLSRHIQIGSFAMYLGAVAQFSAAMNDVMSSIVGIRQFGMYYEELEKYVNMPQKMRHGKQLPEDNAAGYTIQFENVSFKYPGASTYALKNVNITISPAEKLSVVGENGAGKTTFVKLLTRLYEPTEGRILLNGVDIKEIEYDAYQSLMAAVFQDFRLFSFTLKENVCFNQECDDTEIIDCLQRSGFGDKLEKLPKGIYTSIYKNFEEDGFEPSGGEGQKIALARALFKNTPVVILDEPTAALDPRAEYEMYQHFNDMSKGKTTIFISHRLSSSKFCDKIAVFVDGKIVEYGTHDELYQANKLYRELFDMQAKFYQ
ncbi:ABC transporter ATP-binding protein [Emergencia sp. JLR.KK010]|jgi:ABC-type multidrug transport system fused ATPase/permease subunit|uniref:ABC transporter ATP-binding protein n=1 Tax=Anaerovoracaceae TaxID=543314 RepID=UPI00203CC4A0|nr:ABC transporter ATP-binding protein [Senimuribacter intestinalis]